MKLANLPEFNAALRRVIEVTKKAEAEIVTKAAKDVAFRAAQFTPKTSAAQIRQELNSGNLLNALASIACKKRYGSLWDKNQWKDMKKQIIASRIRGVNALRAGWIPAIQKLGGNFRGAKVWPGGSASRGTAKKATIHSLTSWIINEVVTKSARNGRSYGAGEIPAELKAMNEAIVSVTADRLQYAESKLKAAINKVI